MTQTTPTRDEAVPPCWRIQYRSSKGTPCGEVIFTEDAEAANEYRERGAWVRELAPAPASGGDVVQGLRAEIAHDGFAGDIIGRYVTREGKRGAVVQQDGTRVVHVYGEKWLPLETQIALSQSTSAGSKS